MRTVVATLGLGLLCSLAGCNNFRPRPGPGPGVQGGQARLPDRPTAQSLVAYLNGNSRRVQAFRCSDVSIDCKQGNDTAPGLTGKLSCQKPRNFRMTANILSNTEVDIGSNDQEFWYWIKRADPPYVYHCSYEDMARKQVRIPFPFQPDMVMAALGVQDYDDTKQYELRTTARTYELIEPITSPQGQPMQKVVVFSRQQAFGDRPQVVGYVLRDQRGQEICTATISQVQTTETGAVLPRRIKFVWPAEKIEMALKLDGLKVAPIDPQSAELVFSRKSLSQYQSYDLARTSPDHPTGYSGVQRVRGTMR